MTRELTHQLERLGQERRRLEVLLSRQPGWLAWKQLLELPQPADDFGRNALARRKAEIEVELLRDPLFSAHRSVLAAIQVFEDLVAQRHSVEARIGQAEYGDASPAPGREMHTDGASAGKTATGQTRANPVSDGAKDDSRARDVEVMALADRRGSRLVVKAATIHEVPNRKVSVEATLSDAPPDPLTRIRRIDKDLAAALIARGVRHFSQIASFGPADVRALSAALGLGRRISQENWIEQAALLAMKAGASPAVGVPHSRPQPAKPPVAARSMVSDGRLPATEAETTGAGDSAMNPQRAVAAIASAISKAIAGRHVDPANSAQVIGITFADCGEANIEADRSVEADGNESAGSTPAIDPLRQATQRNSASSPPQMVRSAALRIAAAMQLNPACKNMRSTPARPAEAAADMPHEFELQPAVPDDLELLVGVDTQIAALLRSEGVTRFDQIAEWNAAAVAHAQSRLGAKVPIARLGWIEQAALLACGGMTAHAARKARGEFAALVPQPSQACLRDEAFAAWLSVHALSHAPAASASEGTEAPEPAQWPSLEHADVKPAAQPIDAEFEEVHGADAGSGSEVLAFDAHSISVPLVLEPQADHDLAGAEIIQLRRIIEVVADEPDLTALAYTHDGVPDDAVLDNTGPEDAGHATAGDSPLPVPPDQPDNVADDEQRDAAYLDIEAVQPEPEPEPEPEPQPVLQPHAGPSARPPNIADRITAIERDAAELIGAPRLVLDRFKQRRPNLETDAFPVDRHAATPAAPPQNPFSDDVNEADVRIVMRQTHAAGLETVSAPHIGESSEHEKEAFDGKEYAAYRQTVEEASVEIVQSVDAAAEHLPPPETRQALAADAAEANRRAPPVGPDEIGKVRRFLKALRGE